VRKELWYEKAACKILVKLAVIPKFFAQLLSASIDLLTLVINVALPQTDASHYDI